MATSTVVVVGLVVSYVNGEMRHQKSADAQWHIPENPINTGLLCCSNAILAKKKLSDSLVWYEESFIRTCQNFTVTLKAEFRPSAGPTRRDDIPEGLLWWDLRKKKHVSAGDRVGSEFYFYTSPVCLVNQAESRPSRLLADLWCALVSLHCERIAAVFLSDWSHVEVTSMSL